MFLSIAKIENMDKIARIPEIFAFRDTSFIFVH